MRRYVAMMLVGWMGMMLVACSGEQQPAGPPGASASVWETSKPTLSEQSAPQRKIDSPYVPPEVPSPGAGGQLAGQETQLSSSSGHSAGQEGQPGSSGEPLPKEFHSSLPAERAEVSAAADSPGEAGLAPGAATAQKPDEPSSSPPIPDDPEAVKALEALGVTIEHNDQGQVKSVVATKGQMTDEALAWLERLPALEKLEIRGGKITAKGLAHLKNLQGLQRFYLCEVPLEDEALEHLAGLTNLVALSLENTGITGKGLAYLKNLKNLEVFNLADNPIDNKALAHLKALSRLDTITLRNTRITGQGLVHLKSLERLRVLNLKGCKEVTDESLQHLRGLKELRMLYVRDTEVTDEGAKKLKKQIPGLAVFFH